MDPQIAARVSHLPDGIHRLVLDDGEHAIVKRRRDAPSGFFAMEAHGLALLRDSHTLRVPRLYAQTNGALVLEDLGEGRASREAWERAGRALARLHSHTAPTFGLDRDGWCGDSAQRNTAMADGWRFFAECRLLPQGQRAFDAGHLTARDMTVLERLCLALHARIPEQPAALVHGDLWKANIHPCADGELALIDAAAAHYGWAEADLAMLTLFGEPPPALFAAYEETAGCGTDWRTRSPVYNLYHLLNHLNLFGAAYLGGVLTALRA